MANQISQAGIEIDTLQDTIDALTGSFTSIFGSDTVLDANSPDGQLIGDFSQVVQDELDLNLQTYSSFDPDQAIGVVLDQRVALNGIKRAGGTYSTTDVTVVTSKAVNLLGLDGADPANPPTGCFIVSDTQGNQWALINSYSVGSAGSTVLAFQSLPIGAVSTAENTLTVPLTVVAGVTSVNNPTAQLSVGENQEQDSALKIRRRKSTAISASGFADAMTALLLSTTGVTYAQVNNNNTGSTGIPGGPSVPAHSIWVIVGGTASAASIAKAIYTKLGAGCGMYGSQSYAYQRPNGGPVIDILWDDITAEPLYVEFQPNAIAGNISVTGTVANSSPVITAVSSTVGMAPGQLIRGTYIPAGSTILSVDSSSQITISANATNNGSAEALTVVPVNVATLEAQVAAAFSAGPYETLNINSIASLVQSVNSSLYCLSVGLSSDNSSFYNTLTPTALNYQFTLIAADITIT